MAFDTVRFSGYFEPFAFLQRWYRLDHSGRVSGNLIVLSTHVLIYPIRSARPHVQLDTRICYGTFHWEIKGRFPKRVVLANVPSFRFSFRGNIRQNHPFGNHPYKPGENLGQTRFFSLFYTVEARFHRVCPWDKPGLSLGQSRGRRAAQKAYVKKKFMCLFRSLTSLSSGQLM